MGSKWEGGADRRTYHVISEAEYRCARQDGLVHEVEHVCDEQQRDQAPVDLAQDTLRHGGVDAVPARPTIDDLFGSGHVVL